jgi:hypothetical protein
MLRLLSAVSAKALMIWRSDHAQNRMFLEQNSLRVFSGEANPALGMGGVAVGMGKRNRGMSAPVLIRSLERFRANGSRECAPDDRLREYRFA